MEYCNLQKGKRNVFVKKCIYKVILDTCNISLFTVYFWGISDVQAQFHLCDPVGEKASSYYYVIERLVYQTFIYIV